MGIRLVPSGKSTRVSIRSHYRGREGDFARASNSFPANRVGRRQYRRSFPKFRVGLEALHGGEHVELMALVLRRH